MKAVERAVEAAILDEFREIERLGGVLAAVEERYQRSQIQNAALVSDFDQRLSYRRGGFHARAASRLYAVERICIR